MGYEMNAEGINGVADLTIISVDAGWSVASGPTMLLMDATGGGPPPLGTPPPTDVTALQCNGFGKLPAILGNGENAPGVVGVTAFSPPDPSVISLAPPVGFDTNAAVLGVALNQTGTGVLGLAGPITDPTSPAGPGVVGLAGGAPMPPGEVTSGAGVAGIGSPLQHGVPPGRGGVFGSTSYMAQLRLIPGPPPMEKPLLPFFGDVGDLYVTRTPNPQGAHLPGPPLIFMCVTPNLKTEPAMWAPFTFGPEQKGGTTPHL
jgi:hypothetical protein